MERPGYFRYSFEGRGERPEVYQRALRDRLFVRLDGECDVETEWRIAGGDGFWRRRHALGPRGRTVAYEPRIDVAVGPFAIEGRYGPDYDLLVDRHRAVLNQIYDAHASNVDAHLSPYPMAGFDTAVRCNHNARCLLAIEIEKGNGAAKYLLGTAFNAVALGRLGVIVCWDPWRLTDFMQLREYICFLTAAQKNTFSPDNLLIVTRDQLDQILD